MTTTLAAHRLIRLAASHGAAEAVISRLFSAILCEGLDASALAALTALSEEAGLPAGEVRAALAGDEGAAEVLAAAAAALAQGVRGTPIAIIGAEAMPGACSAADYAAALGRASR